MHEQRAGQVERPRAGQALDHPATVVGEAAVLVDAVLGHVQMQAGVVRAREVDGGGEQLVADRERGVQADEGRPAGIQVTRGLGKAGRRRVGAVAVAQLQAEHVGEADLREGIGDDVEAAGDGVRRGVVVDHAGHAAAHRVDGGGEGRGANQVVVERAVEAPPDQLEDLGEVARRPGRGGHAAGEGRVDVVVGADQAGHGEAAAAVDHGGVGVGRRTGGSQLGSGAAGEHEVAGGQVLGGRGVMADVAQMDGHGAPDGRAGRRYADCP